MKRIQCDYSPHHHNGFVAACIYSPNLVLVEHSIGSNTSNA